MGKDMASSCQCTAGATGSLRAMGDAHEDGRAEPHQPGLVPQPQPGAPLASMGRGLVPQPNTLGTWEPLPSAVSRTGFSMAMLVPSWLQHKSSQDPYNNK